MSWYVYINNYMHAPQNVSLRVKLLNSTMQPPNDLLHQPSPFPSLTEIPVHLATNEQLVLPFSWSVLSTSLRGGLVSINQLRVNNSSVNVNVGSSPHLFRMVFELWVYNQTSKVYDFGWYSGSNYSSASIYIWFNLNLPT